MTLYAVEMRQVVLKFFGSGFPVKVQKGGVLQVHHGKSGHKDVGQEVEKMSHGSTGSGCQRRGVYVTWEQLQSYLSAGLGGTSKIDEKVYERLFTKHGAKRWYDWRKSNPRDLLESIPVQTQFIYKRVE